MDGLRFYPFCPLTSLQAATCQTARPRSLSWEYKQRADDRASIISPRSDPLRHSRPPHIFSSPLFPLSPISPLHFRFTPPSTFRPLAIFLATLGHDLIRIRALFLFLWHWWFFAPWKRGADLREILIPLCQLHSRTSRA